MIELDRDLALVAPGGVWVRSQRSVVVADPHAGYIPTLQQRGYALPSGDDRELHARLHALLEKTSAKTMVIAGDLVHGRGATLRRSRCASALDELLGALKGVELVVVEGNHDAGVAERLLAVGVQYTEYYVLGPHRVAHGDGCTDGLKREAMERGGRLVLGHHHPALTLRDGAGTRKKVPAFAWCEGLLCLPALSPFARGADLMSLGHSLGVERAAGGASVSVAVVIGSRVVHVGALDRIRALG